MNSWIDYIFSSSAIREQTRKVFNRIQEGEGQFTYHKEKLEEVCDFVTSVIQENYPSLAIPYHSRWGHFKSGNPNRLALLDQQIAPLDPLEQARIRFDLVITSVLLDAGAGSQWKYLEKQSQTEFSRSEGLGLASFHMFLSKSLSTNNRLAAQAEKLISLSESDITKAFQVSESNPLVGLKGRTQLMVSLGKTLLQNPHFFPGQRPGGLVDYIQEKYGRSIRAREILETVLHSLKSIWPGRLEYKDPDTGELWPLGDTWEYTPLGNGREAYVPFHKLSQWLTYSLIEPLEQSGWTVTHLEDLTGLAEYRNGGLLLDMGLIQAKNTGELDTPQAPSHPLIVEWRALTVQILDLMAPIIRRKLRKTEDEFPMAKILEGGTWLAGRKIARSLRPDGSHPSDSIVTEPSFKGLLMQTHENLKIITHPVVQHKLSLLRDKNTSSHEFRNILKEITGFMTYLSTDDLETVEDQVETPLGLAKVKRIQSHPIAISVMRAGNPMLESILDIIPFAQAGHIGIYKDRRMDSTIEYFFKVPQDIQEKRVLLADPLISTGSTVTACVSRLKHYEVGPITILCILCSEEGLQTLFQAHPDVKVLSAGMEPRVNLEGYLVPGLGDVGDRLYNI